MAVPVVPTVSALATPLPRVFQPRRTTPADVVRPTRAEISLSNLRWNLRALKRRCPVPLWCVLKADAYGHGAKACARTLERAGAEGICVALLEEGLELRDAGIEIPILVMGGFYGRAYSELFAHRLTPVVCDAGQLEELGREARYRGSAIGVHLKVDTGMARLGMVPSERESLVRTLANFPELSLHGLMTHFARADEDVDSVHEQMRVFTAVEAAFAAEGIVPERRHAANTAALLKVPETHLDLVRPGIGVFGIEPGAGDCEELKPVMRVLSTVVALRDLQPGQAVGYGGTWRAQRPTRLATLPIGYADGVARNSSNRRDVLLGGRRAPVVGTVSMDLTTVDVTDIAGVKLGDEAVIMGFQKGSHGQETITAHELAELQGTIPWEVLTQVSRRVPRFYRDA